MKKCIVSALLSLACVGLAAVPGSPRGYSIFGNDVRRIARQKGWTLEKTADVLIGLGITGYDDSFTCKHLDAMAKLPLQAANIYAFIDFSKSDNGRAECETAIAAAKRTKCGRIMCLPQGFRNGVEDEAQFQEIVRGMTAFVKLADAAGVKVTTEPLGGNRACPSSYLKYLKRMLKEIPGLRMTVDSGNLVYAGRGDDVLELVELVKGDLEHLHLKDLTHEDNHRYATMGRGQVPNEAVVTRLIAAGYGGWITIENPVGEDTLADVLRQMDVIRGWVDAARRKALIDAASAPAPATAKLEFRPDSTNAHYACGQTAVLTVTAVDEKGNPLVAGRLSVDVDNYGKRTLVAARTVDLACENPFTLSFTRATPGFARVNVRRLDKGLTLLDVNRDRVDAVVFGLGFDVEKIRPGTPDVADFDAFWAEAVANLEKTVPLDPRLERIDDLSKGAVEVFRVSFASFGGRRVWGWLAEPKDKSRVYPVDLSVPGAGIGFPNPPGGSPDKVVFCMNVHSYRQIEGRGPEADAKRKAAYDAQDARFAVPNGVPRYCQAGIHLGREQYFYYASILGINRAINWLMTRPVCDHARVSYNGTSQGGGFGLYLTYLNPHIKRSCIFVPALTDLLGFKVEDRRSGWPEIVENQKPENRAAAERNAPYFCGVNFARRIRKPIRFVVAFADMSCAPAAVYSAYNVCPSSDKAILEGVGMTHRVFGSFYGRLGAWQNDWSVSR